MSVHWSSEFSKWEFRDLQATAMAVDWSGNNILLAGKRCLAIKHLSADGDNSNSDSVKKILRQSKYDVAGAEWCQVQHGQRLCAISSNQRVDIYHWRNGDLTGMHSLRGHTRVVSDTHWHREDHNLIATCSIDTFTHLWDLRDTRKPVLSLSAVAGASQVQWNKVANHLLATAHDGDVKLWDKRKGSSPIQYISAHLCKIHGLDWSPHHDYQLVTSSHDGTIKFFNINNPRKVESVITTNYPVWRAVYTPFGNGIVTMGVGWGSVSRGEQAGVIGIWVGGSLAHRLVGHSDVVLQMQWRPTSDQSNYQLITWARDQSLRIWMMPRSLLKMCYHYLPFDDSEEDALSDTLSYQSATEYPDPNITSDTLQMTKLSTYEPIQCLKEEFESIRNLENISVTDVDLDHKTCNVKTESNGHVAILKVAFPVTYTFDLAIPRFTWLNGTNLDTITTIKILQTINCAAFQKIRNHLPCLHHCLKILATYLQQIPVKSSEDPNVKKDENRTSSECSEGSASGAGDSCIPFPRTCGAKWCHVGTLVVFHRPPNAKRMSLKPESCTPRSLSSLATPLYVTGTYRSLSPHTTSSPTNATLSQLLHRPPSHSITTFYFQDRWKSSSRRTGSGLRTGTASNICQKITLYNADNLFLLDKQLAEKYAISDMNISDLCNHNALVANSLNRLDLMQTWQLASLVASSLEQSKNDIMMSPNPFHSDDTNNLSLHPFGWNMVQDLIDHYAKISDIQMAAMLSCVFSHYYEAYMISSKSSDLSSNSNGSNSSPYNTIHNICEMNVDGWAVPVLHHDRTSSWSDSTDINPSYFESSLQILGKCNENNNSPVFDSSTIYQYQNYMKTYADILHRWYLLEARAEIMKRVSNGEETRHVGVELVSECHRCKKIIREGRCMKCSLIALNCVICNIGVRGSANACLVCGHGGHTSHLEQWFSKNEVCPTGCGCKCLRETYSIMDR